MRTILASTILLLLCAKLTAQEPDFIRVLRDDDHQVTALETAVVRYEKGEGKDKIILDAIGAIHIGDKAYYKSLNKRFEQYDALCYELVGKKGEPPKKEKGPDLYGLIGTVIQLEGQLAGIDYTAKNFVHADMSMEEIRAKMAERGDDALTLALSSITETLRARNRKENKAREGGDKPPAPNDENILSSPVHLKRFLADGFDVDMSGSGLGSRVDLYLLKDRNEAAMKVVDEQIEKGKKKLGLFYGAAHFPDFHKKLVERGFKPTTTSWERAWDLSKPVDWDFAGILKGLLELND